MSKENDGVNYQAKYFDLKSRYIQSLDVAYRSGYEEGYNQGQIDTQMQNMQMMQAQAGAQPPPQANQQGQREQGSEIDAYIAALEHELNKAEPQIGELKKTLEQAKIAKLIKHEVKTINPFAPKPYQTSTGYKNMNQQDQKALNMQEKIVEDVLGKWEEEEKAVKHQTETLLNTEILKKSLKKSLDIV